MDSRESDRALCQRYSKTIWSTRDLSVIDELIAENAIIHSPLSERRGPKEMRSIVEVWLSAFPDLEVSHEISLSDDGVVALSWTAKGTHQGEFKGISPTGRKVCYRGVSMYRVKENQIVEYWCVVNVHTIMAQLQEPEVVSQ